MLCQAPVWPGECLKLQTAEAASSLMTPQAGALSLAALMTDWAQKTDREQWPRAHRDNKTLPQIFAFFLCCTASKWCISVKFY